MNIIDNKITFSCSLQITFHMTRITNYRLNNITLEQKGSSSHKNAITSRHGKQLQKRNSRATWRPANIDKKIQNTEV